MAVTTHRANILRRIATAVVVLALILPALRNRDGLPLSTYPMYAGTRSDVLEFVVAYGVARDGSQVSLSMTEIAGTRDPLIAESFLNDALARGSGADVCAQIARRVDAAVSRIEIVRERRNVLDHVADRASQIETTLLESCDR